MLEDLKHVRPRIPAPELTEEETARLGERAHSLEAALRLKYLGYDAPGGGFSREPDTKATLDYAFKTQLFWIVSRLNNCHY